MEKKPLIVDIKRNSYEDGKGIRSVIFFKGCYLSCIWCHNPECQSKEPEIGFLEKRCIFCFECEKACSNNAITRAKRRIERKKCNLCFRCVDACPSRAIQRIGRFMEIDELLEVLLKDRVFYEASGGGVTLSGGEPTLFPEYVSSLLIKCKEKNIDITLQTSGFFEYSGFKRMLLPYLSLIMYDIKLINPIEHKRYTGKDNKIILENFKLLIKEGVRVLPRIPLIPGITNKEEIIGFLTELGVYEHKELPYNPLANSKWEMLDKKPLSVTFCS